MKIQFLPAGVAVVLTISSYINDMFSWSVKLGEVLYLINEGLIPQYGLRIVKKDVFISSESSTHEIQSSVVS